MSEPDLRVDREPFPHERTDGETVYVDPVEGDAGTEGAFLAVCRSPDRGRRYGWYRAACEGLDVAMDTMGRVECDRREAAEWDAAREQARGRTRRPPSVSRGGRPAGRRPRAGRRPNGGGGRL